MTYYDFRCGLSQQQCINQLTLTFGDEAPKLLYITGLLNCGHGRSLTDEFKESRSKSVVVPENIDMLCAN